MRIKHFALYVLLGLAGGFFSCEKNDVETPERDYTIESTPYMEVVSSYPNGWTKEAVYYKFNGDIKAEVEFYENGYIKTCKRYVMDLTSVGAPTYPGMKVERNEDNQTTSSEYYYPDGSPYATFKYNNGELKEKKVYENGLATFNYDNGKIKSIVYEKGDSPHKVTVEYDYQNNSRSFSIFENNTLAYGSTGNISPNEPGYGYLNGNFIPTIIGYNVGEPIGSNIYRSYFEGLKKDGYSDHAERDIFQMFSDNLRRDFMDPLEPAMIVNTDIYRNFIEQFPLGESIFKQTGHFIKNRRSVNRKSYILPEKQTGVSEEVYHLKYGDSFHSVVYRGRYFIITGLLRNMPADPDLRDELTDIAFKKMRYMIDSDENTITEKEAEMLDNVFFEVKVFSNAPGYEKGIVIHSNQDIEQFMGVFADTEEPIQFDYRPHLYPQ